MPPCQNAKSDATALNDKVRKHATTQHQKLWVDSDPYSIKHMTRLSLTRLVEEISITWEVAGQKQIQLRKTQAQNVDAYFLYA